MTIICPLCGKIKPEDSLFCDACSDKLNNDFEINIHENNHITSNKLANSDKSESLESPTASEEKDIFENKEEEAVLSNELLDSEINDDNILNSNVVDDYESTEKTIQKKRVDARRSLFWIVVVGIILIGAFLIYNKIIVRSIDRRAWESAVYENSVSGYLAYIESHPNGVYFDEAQSGLMKLKEIESITWERLKVSDNLDELVSFLRQYENSPYTPLIRIRIDSLSWISALRVNSVASYSEYMINTQNGLINGDYMFEASKRHEMLFQSAPVNSSEIDSIRSTIIGFYAALSRADQTGLYNYLAPEVYRFFDSGRTNRERITGQLMITTAQVRGQSITFEPNLESLMYERETNGSYKVNVSIVKSYLEDGMTLYLPGYIAHIELNTGFGIMSIYETKPFSGSP